MISKKPRKYPKWFDNLIEDHRKFLLEAFFEAEDDFYNETKKYPYHIIMKRITVSDMDIITKWCDENLKNCLPFPNNAIGKYKSRVYWVYFSTVEDMVYYKLRWG